MSACKKKSIKKSRPRKSHGERKRSSNKGKTSRRNEMLDGGGVKANYMEKASSGTSLSLSPAKPVGSMMVGWTKAV